MTYRSALAGILCLLLGLANFAAAKGEAQMRRPVNIGDFAKPVSNIS